MSEEIVKPHKAVQSDKDNADNAAPSPFPAPADAAPAEPGHDAFSWTASEYIAHHKDTKWYAGVIVITIVVVTLTYFITRDRISAITIFVVGIIFCLAAARKPRVMNYALDHDGVTVGQHFYPYSEYRSYSLVHEGAFTYIELLPMKRYLPMTSMRYAPDDEETILGMLASHIPYEERPSGYIERFARHIRF